MLKYCQCCCIVFGAMRRRRCGWWYDVGEIGLSIQAAALLAACLSLPGGALRAFGSIVSDRFGAHQVTWWLLWVSWIGLFLLCQRIVGQIGLPTPPTTLTASE